MRQRLVMRRCAASITGGHCVVSTPHADTLDGEWPITEWVDDRRHGREVILICRDALRAPEREYALERLIELAEGNPNSALMWHYVKWLTRVYVVPAFRSLFAVEEPDDTDAPGTFDRPPKDIKPPGQLAARLPYSPTAPPCALWALAA